MQRWEMAHISSLIEEGNRRTQEMIARLDERWREGMVRLGELIEGGKCKNFGDCFGFEKIH